MDLFLCRHGETEHNSSNTIQGQSESKLTEKGFKQAEKLKERFEEIEIDFVYSSSMPRAKNTAKIIAEYHGLELKESDELKEISRAKFEGEKLQKLVAEIEKSEIEEHLWKPEGGESLKEVQQRALTFLEEIRNKHRGEKVLVISHSCTIGALIMGLLGQSAKNSWKLSQDNCCVNKLTWSSERDWELLVLNSKSHL